MSGGRNISLTIFIAAMSGSKSLMPLSYRFFHFRRPPGLRLAFDAAVRNGKFGLIYCQRRKESIFLQKDSESQSKKKQSRPNELPED